MSTSPKTKVAIIGSGNIGTDLMIKVIRLSQVLEVAAMVGTDPASGRAGQGQPPGVPTTAAGVQGLMALPGFADIVIVFDATSAKAHKGCGRLVGERPPGGGGGGKDDAPAVGGHLALDQAAPLKPAAGVW